MVRWRGDRRWMWIDFAMALLVGLAALTLVYDGWYVSHADDGLVKATAKVTAVDAAHTAGTVIDRDGHPILVELPLVAPPPTLGAPLDVVYPDSHPERARRANPVPWIPIAVAATLALVACFLWTRARFHLRYLRLLEGGPEAATPVTVKGHFLVNRSVLYLWAADASPTTDRPIGRIDGDFVDAGLSSDEPHAALCAGPLRRGGIVALWIDGHPVALTSAIQRC